jgi:hypothetical protein
MRSIAATIALLATLTVAGCGESSSDTSGASSTEGHVSRADYGKDWPLTVESGTLHCEDPGAVTFTADNGTTYWVNGTAGNQAKTRGWADIRSIWADDPAYAGLKINIGPLIDDGLKL